VPLLRASAGTLRVAPGTVERKMFHEMAILKRKVVGELKM